MKQVTIIEPGVNRLFPNKTLTVTMTDEEYHKLDDMQDRNNWHCLITVKNIELHSADEVREIFQPTNYKRIKSIERRVI